MKIIAENTNTRIPWEKKPIDSDEFIWRYSLNPAVPRDALPSSNSIFNCAVIPFKDHFAGVFRVDDKSRHMTIRVAFSNDAINWTFENDVICFVDVPENAGNEYFYDPRVTYIDGKYIVTWCNGYYGPTIGMAWTEDFKIFHQLPNSYLPFNRNGVLFPRKINGEYLMLNRPSDNGHTPFGDIFISHSPDLTYWGKHYHVMGPREGWDNTKIGAGPIPIETDQGWVLIYHGVLNSCNGFVYSMGAALLDIDKPWKVIKRPTRYLMAPIMNYECVGDVPNVVFPCAALTDSVTGDIAVYYGAADTTLCLAFTNINEIETYLNL